MKKLMMLFIMGLVFTSCNMRNSNGNEFSPDSQLDVSHVIVVDGCEYFVVDAYAALTYVHKGNCNNPIHQSQSQIQKSNIKFYDLDGNYSGFVPVDSMIVNYKTKRITCWYQGNLALMTELKDLGMTTLDVKK